MQFFLVTCDVPANARQQVRERHPDGCYHRALHLLGGYPIWRSEDILLQFWAVSEDYYRAVSNSAFNATTIIAPATKAATYPRMFATTPPT
jgi:hypothetical protein